MEDWSLPDNPDSTLNSINGMVGTAGYWKQSPFNPLNLSNTEDNGLSSPQQPLSFTSGQMPSTDIQEDIEKLFQQTFTLQQQQQEAQQQQHLHVQQQLQQEQQQQQQQHLHKQYQQQSSSYQTVHPSYQEHRTQQTFNHSQSSLGQAHISPGHISSNPLLSPGSYNLHQHANTVSPTLSSSRKRSHSPTNSEQLTPTINRQPFVDPDSLGNNLIINPVIYNIPYRTTSVSTTPTAIPPQSSYDNSPLNLQDKATTSDIERLGSSSIFSPQKPYATPPPQQQQQQTPIQRVPMNIPAGSPLGSASIPLSSPAQHSLSTHSPVANASNIHIHPSAQTRPAAAHQSPVQTRPTITSHQSPVQTRPTITSHQSPIQSRPTITSHQSPVQSRPTITSRQSPVQSRSIITDLQSPIQKRPSTTTTTTTTVTTNNNITTAPSPSSFASTTATATITTTTTSDMTTQLSPTTNRLTTATEHLPQSNRSMIGMQQSPMLQQKTASPPPPKQVLQPRPQLRVHIKKRRPQSPRPCVKEDTDPMLPELDKVNLRRLTVAILKNLGVVMTVDELPTVDIDQHLPTDSEQVLPAAAMQLITTMILGTSGDKEVSQTVGSQICNGDLVALQRMIVAGLKTKNIVIHTVQTSMPSSSSPSIATPSAGNSETKTHLQQKSNNLTNINNTKDNGDTKSRVSSQKVTFDLSTVTYHTPSNVTRLFLRLYRFILNILLSTPDCWPFIQPVPASAVFYHQEIKYPMDLSTIEQNMWNGLYTRFAKFEQDMQLIWKNAKSFHRNAGAIPKHAENLENLFYKVVLDLKKQISNYRKPLHQRVTCQFKFDTSDALPEESDFSYPPMKQVFSKQSILYGIAAISPLEPKAKKPKGLTYDKQLYLQLNGPFFHAVEQMKQDPFGNHPPVPRFYIAKNRTLLRQVRAQGVLAIFYNTKTTRTGSKAHKVETDVVIAYPASPLFDIDQTDDFAPKGWIHLRPLKVIEKMVFSVNETIERDYFRRMFATSKFTVMDDNNKPTSAAANNNKSETKRILKKMVQQILDLPETDDNNEDEDSREQILDRRQSSNHRQQQKQKHHKPSASTTTSVINVRNIKQQVGRISSSEMEVDDENKNHVGDEDQKDKDLMDVDTWTGKMQQEDVIMTIKKEKPNESFSSASFSTPEDNQRSTLSPESVSSIVSPQTKALETVIPTIPVSHSRKSEMSHKVWQKLLNVCTSKGADIVNVQEKYDHLNWSAPDSEGFFKQVYFLNQVVVQTFRQMTMYQRITEVACLMKLRNLPHMAQLREVLYNNNGDIIGLSMERYQTTLKQYTHAHSHHRLTAYQKYDIVYQMLDCMKTIHKAGLAHRDLSEVNIMVNTIDGELEDGTSKICLYLIDFGKAVFCDSQDLCEWFVDVPRSAGEYDGDVVPESEEELKTWCESLPWIKGKPDHGYRMYRSIQTLPKTRSDTQVLPWLIHPQSEDVYSIGVMIWKIFTETEPWRGILDTDLQGLRYVAEDDYRIQRALEHEVHGELSRQLLLKCLRTRPQDRDTAADILEWLGQDDIRIGLLNEWKMYSSETRATRKVKTMYGFDYNDATSTTNSNAGTVTATTTTDDKRNKRARRGNGGTNTKSKGRSRKLMDMKLD